MNNENIWPCNGRPLIQLWILCKRPEKKDKKDKKSKKVKKKDEEEEPTEIYLKPR